MLGVMGALMGGVATAATLMGPAGFPQIMRAAAAASAKQATQTPGNGG
jgi:hypothetical protein